MAQKSNRYYRCLKEIRDLAGLDIPEDELADLAEEILRRARAREREREGMSADQAVSAVLAEMSDEIITEAKLRKRQAYLMASAFARESQTLQDVWMDRPVDGLASILVGSNIARRDAQRSVDADQKGLANEFLNGFAADLEKSGFLDLFKTGGLDLDAYRALDELYKDNPDFSNIRREARQFAEIVFKYQEAVRTGLNDAGAWIKKTPDYITHQGHDMFKVRRAAFELGGDMRTFFTNDDKLHFKAWLDFTMPLLAPETFAGNEHRKEEFMWHVWRNIASGMHMKSNRPGTGFELPPSLAARRSRPRILRFKDADSRYKYDTTFGRGGSLMERVALGLYRSGHEIALMRRLGPNPTVTFNRLKLAAKLQLEDSVKGRDASRWFRDEQILDAYFAEVTGEASIPGADPGSAVLRASRMLQALSKLGAAVISAIGDNAVVASELRYHGIHGLENWKAQFDAMLAGRGKRGQSRAARLQLASELGVTVDYLRGSVWSRFSAEDALPGWAARAQYFFFKINGLMWWTDTLRQAIAATFSHNLALNAKKSIPELSEELQRLFKIFGVTENEWDLMRTRAIDVVEGREYFTPKGADRLTDAEIAALLELEGAKPSPRRIRERREQIKTKFRDYFASRADYAVLIPGPRSRIRMTGANMGIKPGTLGMEIMKSISQFKGFPLAVLEKVYGREIYGYSESGKVRDMSRRGLMGLAGYIAYATFLGFIAMNIKAYLMGRELKAPRNAEETAQMLAAAMLQGGGLGLYGDFLVGQARDRYGQSAFAALLGPAFGTIERLYRLMLSGDADAAEAFFFAKSHAPFINLFYTRMALDYLIMYRLQESFSPGSLKRMEDRIRQDLNQEFKLPPSRNYRVEDLTADDLATLLTP